MFFNLFFGSSIVEKLVDLSAIGECLVWIISSWIACLYLYKIGNEQCELKSIKSRLSLDF